MLHINDKGFNGQINERRFCNRKIFPTRLRFINKMFARNFLIKFTLILLKKKLSTFIFSIVSINVHYIHVEVIIIIIN